MPGIAGLAKAAEMLYSHFDEDHARLCACKRRFIEGVERLDQVKVNGLLPDAPYGEGTAAHIVSVSFAGVRSEVLLHALEDKGIYVSAEGDYVEHPTYDLQFKFTSCEIKMPDDVLSIEKYLGSGIIKGVGEALAKRIVKKFRMDSLLSLIHI